LYKSICSAINLETHTMKHLLLVFVTLKQYRKFTNANRQLAISD